VNVASRLVGFSSGEDVVVSSSVYSDPEVESLLTGAGELHAESFEAVLRGYDEESFRLWRVRQ
jgi:class 3 adenylate cyclase